MLTLSATCQAIANAIGNGTLRLVECEGRFGSFIAIMDVRGTIEVADTQAEADERIASIRGRLA